MYETGEECITLLLWMVYNFQLVFAQISQHKTHEKDHIELEMELVELFVP